MAAVRIRKATISDSPAIRALEQRIWQEEEVTGKYELMPCIRFGKVFVATADRQIVGAIVALRTAEGFYICDWVVDPAWRGRGIGGKLYRRLLGQRVPLLTTVRTSNHLSFALHRRMGFRPVTKVRDWYGVGGEERFLMRHP